MSFLDKWERELHGEWYLLSDVTTDTKTHDELIALIPNEAKDILDIGAGDGYIVRKLKEKGKAVIGTTISKQDTEAYGLEHLDMHDLRWPEGSFDVVIARHVLEHALSPRLVIREARRVLRDGCLFLVETPINHDGIEGENRAHFYCFSCAQWEELIRKNGFSIVKTEYSGSSYRIIAKK